MRNITKVPDPWPALSSLRERYAQTTRVLYRLFLIVFTFICMISLARYDHNPAGSPPIFLSPTDTNNTFEHICTISAREADIPVGPMRAVIPYFMLCPTTLTFLATCIAFTLGIIKLQSFNPGVLFILVPNFIVILLFNIEWRKGVLVSLQMLLPMYVWSFTTVAGLMHPLLMWLSPSYRSYIKRQREQKVQKETEMNTIMDPDLEAGDLRNEDEGTPLLPMLPLTGRGFRRNPDGAYVENPQARALVPDLYDRIRS